MFAITMVSSCKGDKGNKSLEDVFSEEDMVLDFTINGQKKPGFDRIGQDYLDTDYYDDPQNEDHVMHIGIGDTIYFRDESKLPADIKENRKWYIDANELPDTGEEVAWYSDIPSTFMVTLKFGDGYTVQKGVYLHDDLESFSDFLEEDEEETSEAVADNSSSSQNSSRSNNSSSTTSTPPPPPPKPTINNVDFSFASPTIEAGKGLVFRDQSTPASAINVRVWDFGDGNNQQTRGSTVKHVFRKEGSYKVKLCLNYSSKCTSKTISVTPATQVLVTTPPKTKDNSSTTSTNATPPPKAEVSKVFFSMPSTAKVGKPVTIEDTSIPQSAVTKRDWFVNGSNINLNRSKLSRTFDKGGKYEIRLCVNESQKDCYSSVITVEEDAPLTSDSEEFLCMSTKKVGVRSANKCPVIEVKKINNNTKVTLKPTTTIELRNATLYGVDVGFVDVKLTSSDGKLNKILKKVQILPGRSKVEFGEFATTLEKGKTYTLEVVMPSDGSLFVEDAGACNTDYPQSDELNINYENNNMVLMDIKFCY